MKRNRILLIIAVVLLVAVIAVVLVVTLGSKGTEELPKASATKNTVVDNSETFDAIVLHAGENSIMVEPTSDYAQKISSDKISVSLGKFENPPQLKEGDTVRITYDGVMAESYPPQIFGVYDVQVIDEK